MLISTLSSGTIRLSFVNFILKVLISFDVYKMSYCNDVVQFFCFLFFFFFADIRLSDYNMVFAHKGRFLFHYIHRQIKSRYTCIVFAISSYPLVSRTYNLINIFFSPVVSHYHFEGFCRLRKSACIKMNTGKKNASIEFYIRIGTLYNDV